MEAVVEYIRRISGQQSFEVYDLKKGQFLKLPNGTYLRVVEVEEFTFAELWRGERAQLKRICVANMHPCGDSFSPQFFKEKHRAQWITMLSEITAATAETVDDNFFGAI